MVRKRARLPRMGAEMIQTTRELVKEAWLVSEMARATRAEAAALRLESQEMRARAAMRRLRMGLPST